jgi:hypothetical protein
VTDADQVGAVSAIELYQGETLVEALTDLSVREFTGLLSNNEYTVKVTYTYDLNDGLGSQTLTINQAATTLAKATPVVVVDNIVPTQTSFGFGITVTDADQVGAVSAIELYQGETLVEALTDLSVREFTGLLSNNEYTVKVTYTYDLYDGEGEQELVTYGMVEEIPDNINTVTELNANYTENGIVYGKIFYAGFGPRLGDPITIGITDGNSNFYAKTLGTPDDFPIGKMIIINYIYDEIMLETFFYDFSWLPYTDILYTLAKTTPVLIVDNIVPTQTSLGFGITVTDADQVGAVSAIELYQGETLVEALTDLSVREFTGLLSNNEYTIKVTYTYDLNDGVGSQTLTVNQAATTVAKATPNIDISSFTAHNNKLYIDLQIEDIDYTYLTSYFELYNNNNELIDSTNDIIDYLENINPNTNYSLKIIFSYNLNDGMGVVSTAEYFEINVTYFGSGTAELPYEIYTIIDLINSQYYSYNHFILMNDLNLADIVWSPLGDGIYNNVLDGQFFTISNLNIDYINDNQNYGLFKSIGVEGVVKNLFIEGTINVVSSEGINVGLLSGTNMGVIEQVGAIGSITASGTYVFVGGLVGRNGAFGSNRISNSYAGVDISVNASVFTYTGGLTSYSGSTIENSYSYGEILVTNSSYSETYVGGFVGFHDTGFIINSFSLNNIQVNNDGYNITNHVGHFYAHTNSGVKLQNIFGFNQQSIAIDDIIVEPDTWKTTFIDMEEVNPLWYKNILNWSDNTWYYYQINVGFDKYPTLVDPILDINFVNTGKEEIEVNLYTSSKITIVSLVSNLYLDSFLVGSSNQNQIVFGSLLSNKNYNLEVVLQYRLSEEGEILNKVLSTTYSTDAKAIPVIELEIEDISSTSIGFGVNISDSDEIGSITAIELYLGETLVETLIDLNVREFTGLLSNNEYTIKVTYTYDLNDGFSILSFSSSITSRTTIEEVIITNIQVMNSVTPTVGDSVSLKIFFENPSQVIFNKFVINGMDLDVLFSNSTSGIVQFIPDSEGGEYYVNIEKLHYTVDGEAYIYTFSYAIETHFNILGLIEYVDFYGDSGKIYVSGDTTDYFILELSNLSNFNVYSITLEHTWGTANYSFEEIEMIDNNHYRIVNKFGSTWSTGTIVSFIRLKSIEYGYTDTEIYSKNFDNLEYKVFYNTISHITRQITNIDDLQNMENGYIYELTSSLDLSNVAWTPYEFYGVILGNGYSIDNLNIFNLNTSSSEQNYGLFTMFGGVIQDLTINNPNVYIKTNGRVNYGTIAASTNNTTYKNISVIGANVIIESIESVDFSGLGRSYNIFNVGISNSQFIIKGKNVIASGIATGSSLIIDAYFESSSIEVTDSANARVSGISSGMYIENATINDVILKATAQGNVYLGGISSENSYGINNVSIHNLNIIITTDQIAKVGSIAGVFSYGIISKAAVNNVSLIITSKSFSGETNAVGLLVGQTSDNSHINNSYACNSIINIEGIDMWIGGLVGFLYSGKLEDSYAYNNQIIVNSTAISSFGVLVGGLIGSFGSDQPFLNNSFVIKGSITVTSSSYTQVDYLTGRTTMATINNSYVFADCEVFVNGASKENTSFILIGNAEDADFYTITLGWSESIWDFSIIDYLDGRLPILK